MSLEEIIGFVGLDRHVQAAVKQRDESDHGEYHGHVSDRLGLLRFFDRLEAGHCLEYGRRGDQLFHGRRLFLLRQS